VYTNSTINASSIFDGLRAEVPLDRIIEMNGHRKALCVSPDHDDGGPSMHIYSDHVHCFGCGFHGDVTDVWGALHNIERPLDAAVELAKEFSIQLPKMSEEARIKAEERRAHEDAQQAIALASQTLMEKPDDPESNDDARAVREWWEKRGFGEELRERFLLGASSPTTATIPFWTRGSRVKGIIQRRLQGEPKYLLPKGRKGLFIPAPLGKNCFLVEGYVDALAIAAAGKSAIAIGGTQMSEDQLEELRSAPARYYVLTDADESGAEAAREWGKALYPQTFVCSREYGQHGKDAADLLPAIGVGQMADHLDRLMAQAKDPIDVETDTLAEMGGDRRDKLAYALQHIVPMIAKIGSETMRDASAAIVAERVKGLNKKWLTNGIKEELDRLEAEELTELMRKAKELEELAAEEHQARVQKAQPEIDKLFRPGVLERLRNDASKVHHVERDERPLEMAILIALGAQLAPLANGRPAGASALLTADAGRGKNHLADAAVELLPEEFYIAFEIVSAQAFYYAVEDNPDFLRHKFIYPNEIEGVEALVEFLRPMLSKAEAKKFVTDAEPGTGRNTMRTLLARGPVTTIIPTVRNKTDDQLQTRLLMGELEDYVGRVKIHSRAISNLYHPKHAQADFSRERFLWAEGLKQLTVIRRVVFRIDHDDFAYDDDKVSHGARLWANLLGLMSAHAWLEQKNRRILDLGDEKLAIEATPDDYEAAFNVFTEVCKRTTVNLSATHRKILEGLWKLMENNPERDGFRHNEIAAAGEISRQAVTKHKTYLVASAKLVCEGEDGLILNAGVAESDWQLGDFTQGLPSPDQVREWWGSPPDGGGGGPRNRSHRGQSRENGQKADTYADSSGHVVRGQAVATATAYEYSEDGEEERGHGHTLATGGVASENGIDKPTADGGETLATVATPSQDTPTTTRVVNVHSGEDYDLYIGRATPGLGLKESDWRNPYKIGEDGTREEVIEKFETYLTQDQPDLMARLPELEGKTLACWCKPEHCHGDVLARLADSHGPVPPASPM
jgi:DNA primase